MSLESERRIRPRQDKDLTKRASRMDTSVVAGEHGEEQHRLVDLSKRH